MKITNCIDETRKIIKNCKKCALSIGFIPTMGFLHQGHLSLIERARNENDFVVVSIFVNPTQFAPNEDFEKYPRNISKDIEACKNAGADLIFAPDSTEMYPSENLTFVDVKALGENLCGSKREGHFRGVCTVVTKLFNIIMPDNAYFGEKDAQQLRIVKQLTRDLNFDTNIVSSPIVRDKDGLALSSRNSYLSEEERRAALSLNASLIEAKKHIMDGERDVSKIKARITAKISSEPLAIIDYVEILDSDSLKPINKITASALIAVAVYFGKTRLIDNFTFEGEVQ